MTPFAIDMYLPAFSRIVAEYKTTTSAISLSLSTYFVGFALGAIESTGRCSTASEERGHHMWDLVLYILCSVGLCDGFRLPYVCGAQVS